MKIDKTMRLLTIFCLFNDCEEVELREITDYMPVSKKTLGRDLKFLKQAGLIRWRFDRKSQTYLPQKPEGVQPVFPENKTQRRYMERILRLCRLIVEMDGEEQPIQWYRETFPELSDRTRQRDFKILKDLGISIDYHASDGYIEGYWDCNYCGPFTLNTLSKKIRKEG